MTILYIKQSAVQCQVNDVLAYWKPAQNIEKHDETLDVGGDVRSGIGQRIANSGLGGEMYHVRYVV